MCAFADRCSGYCNHNDAGINSFVILGLAALKSQEAALLVEKIIRDGFSEISFLGNYLAYKASIGLINR